MLFGIDPLLALGVVLATAATDAVYVMFTSAVIARRRVPAATWSSVWYLLSSFAVISYTNNWVYVLFAAVGSWIGAYVTMTFLHGPPSNPPAPLKPSPLPGVSEKVLTAPAPFGARDRKELIEPWCFGARAIARPIQINSSHSPRSFSLPTWRRM